MKETKHDILINGNIIKVLSDYDKKANNTKIKVEQLEFNSLKEFFYFINMLTDTAEVLKEREDYAK